MDVRKEQVMQEEVSECEIIEVVDLTVQVKKDAGQTMAELKAHVSLKFTIHWLQLHGPYSSSLGLDHACFVGCCFSCSCCSTNALGNAVTVYPETVQGLTFYHSKDN